MTRQERKRIFYLLVALFFVAGTGIVLYAQGWRLNLESWNISKIGGIFVRSLPDNAQIVLDGKPIKNESAFLSRGTFVSDLFPKTYWVELKEDGYDPWRESATVSPSLVAEFKSAVLVPKNATTAAARPVQSFFTARDILTTQNSNGLIASDGISIGKGILVDENSDGNAAIIKNQTNGRYDWYQFQNGSTTDLTAILSASGAEKNSVSNIFFDPHDSGKIIATGPSQIWLIDIANMSAQSATPAGGQNSSSGEAADLIEKTSITEIDVNTVAAGSSLIAWAESKKSSASSTIMIYDESSDGITASTTVAGKNTELSWVKDGTLGILQNDGELYLYDIGAQTTKKIADDVTYFSSTENGTAIAALENRSMEIIPTTGVSDDYYRFNLPDIANAKRVMWYKDDTHLFVTYDNYVSFLDLADANLNNFTTVALGTAPFYDHDKNDLYLISPSQDVIRFDFPN